MVMNDMRVYLADDDEDDVYLFSTALRSVGTVAAFDSAVNGQDLLRKLEHNSALPSLIFLDINMPVMNGLECLTKIKEHNEYRNICIIMLSTSISKENVEMAFQLGADLYIQKPSAYDSLKEMIHKYTQPDALKRPPEGQFLITANN